MACSQNFGTGKRGHYERGLFTPGEHRHLRSTVVRQQPLKSRCSKARFCTCQCGERQRSQRSQGLRIGKEDGQKLRSHFTHTSLGLKVSLFERGLFTGEISRISKISRFSKISRKWSDSPLFSTVWGLSEISEISKFSRISRENGLF